MVARVAGEDILDILPTSLDDFESVERDLTLQRKLSSPLLSPATTSRQSFSPLVAAPCLQEEPGTGAQSSPWRKMMEWGLQRRPWWGRRRTRRTWRWP